MIAALYVEKDGAYFGIEGVDPWDETRDARGYAGVHSGECQGRRLPDHLAERTPEAFRDVLLAMARSAAVAEVAA